MAKKYCYLFSEGNAKMRELLGGKGANLAEMTGMGLPVPQGFTISTEACTQYYEDGRQINPDIQAEIMEHFVSVLPSFELYPFQNADARDAIVSGLIESGKVDLSTIEGIPWHTLSEKGKNPAVGK